MRVEYKGGSCNFAAKRIFITTNSHPREWLVGNAELSRRITEIREFPSGTKWSVGSKEVTPTGYQGGISIDGGPQPHLTI